MEKQGYNSKPVKIGAVAGFVLGGLAGIMRHQKVATTLVDAMCVSGFGIITGQLVNFIENKKQK